MAGELVLLTGGTGHIGFRTLVEALRAGYTVRAAIRRESSIAEIKATASIKPYLDKLSFVIVSDITKDGAFDEALKDVTYVVHLASPLAKPTENPEQDIIQPAIHGTNSILYSALKVPSVKRVVITASETSVIPAAELSGSDKIWTPDHKVENPTGPYPNYFVAYAASKVLAHNKTLDFIEKEKPHFTIINIMPSFVIGKNELATTPEAVLQGSNGLAMGVLFGQQNPAGQAATTVHVDDVAFVHIKSLDPKLEGNHNFACNSNGLEGIEWDDAIEIVKKHFPAAVKKGVFPLGGSQLSKKVMYDARKTEEVFDFKFKSFEEQIVSEAGWYVEVSQKA